jgi:hypothetical protein
VIRWVLAETSEGAKPPQLHPGAPIDGSQCDRPG